MTMLGYLSTTLERCQESKASKQNGNKSPVYWFTVTDELKVEKSWKQLRNAALQEVKMKILHEVMLGILKRLNR